MVKAWIGARNGLYFLDDGKLDEVGLQGKNVSALWVHNDLVLAGTYEDGLYRSTDGGTNFEHVVSGLTAPCFRTISTDPLQPNTLLAGTEPGRIYRSSDEGATWTELDGVTRLDGVDEWYLPYSPRAGAVRNIYAPAEHGTRLLASVEVGGLLDSHDGGKTWSYLPVLHDDDIHHVTGHPDDPDLLYVSLGYAGIKSNPKPEDYKLGGVARSDDGGKTFVKVETDYTRATIVPPTRVDLVLTGPAPHVGRQGRIAVSDDRGETWHQAMAGLEFPLDDMVELFVPGLDGDMLAILSGGRLINSYVGAWEWDDAVPINAGINVESIALVR